MIDKLPDFYRIGRFEGGRLVWLVPGVDYALEHPPGSPTLFAAAASYIKEHVVPRGGDPKRSWYGIQEWLGALGPDKDCSTLTRADGRRVVESQLARGLKPATARRNMAIGLAALNHAKKEERISVVPKFQMPDASQPRLRWLRREEHRALMLLPKPPRRQKFWILGFGTGARSRAIETLKWSQVNFKDRIIDYRVPGVVYRNKRRAAVPISDSLLPRLLNWHDRKTDDYVIGLSERGTTRSTYTGCKADLAAIGISEVGIARHVARHTVASWMLQGDPERGIPPASIYDVAQFLGDTVAMVEKVYGHLQPHHLMRAAAVLP